MYLLSVLNTEVPSLTTSTLPNQATSEVSIVLLIHCRNAGHSLQPAEHMQAKQSRLATECTILRLWQAPMSMGRPRQVGQMSLQTCLCAPVH